jgi:cytochrome d ubiquinol oxidase subunit II
MIGDEIIHLDLPATWAGMMLFALCMYITLDGFDLGVGILLLSDAQEVNRDLMVRSMAPVWDGSKTWIVLTAVALLGGFPLAYGILLSAFCVSAVAMLLCLAFRETAFEFRFQTIKRRHIWDIAFRMSDWPAVCQEC